VLFARPASSCSAAAANLLLVSIFISILLFSFWNSGSVELLGFDRAAIDSGDYWRLLGGNWVHLSPNHAWGNLAGLAIVAYISWNQFHWLALLSLLLVCALSVGVGLYGFAPDLASYVGFSGVLHGLLVIVPFVSRKYDNRFAVAFAVVVVSKVLWEQTHWYDDMALYDWIGGRVETRSHLLGLIGAGTWAAAMAVWPTFTHKLGYRHGGR
jgi:rhomboid family GlyGly-CTERM serine protease